MEIIIGKGIDILQFGEVESGVINRLGKPDKVYKVEGARRLQFFDLQLVVALESEQGNRFGWAEVKNPNATIGSQKLIGVSAEKVLAAIATVISESPDHEGFETYYYENHCLELQFEFNGLRSVNFGFCWKNDGTPDWP